MSIQQTGSEHDMKDVDEMIDTAYEYPPDHDYQPGDEHHPMHTDPLCRVCGRAANSYRHY